MPAFDPAFDIAYEAGSFPPAFEVPTFPGGLIQRYITSLSAAGLMYYSLSEPVFIGNNDFEVECPSVTVSTATQSIMSCSMDLIFKVLTISGVVWVLVGDGSAWQRQINSGVSIDDGESHVVGFRKTSSTYEILVDDVVVTSTTDPDPVSVIIDRIGLSSSGYFTGELYDVKIWTGGDRNTGTMLHIPIDEDWKTSTDLHDAEGNVVGSAINITEDEAEFYTLIDNGTAWQSATRTIPIAGGA